MSTRLKRYRAFNERLRLTTPDSALKQQLYVNRPGLSAAEQIIGHMEPSPTSQIALVGGIGSGKSTELLLATQRIATAEDTRAFYIDVSELHDLDHLDPGVLIAAVGLKLCDELDVLDPPWLGDKFSPSPNNPMRTDFRKWAETQERVVVDSGNDEPEYDEDGPRTVRKVVAGKLSMPKRVERSMDGLVQILRQLRASLPPPNQYLVAVLDSLDRISDMDAFATAINADLPLLQKAGIGVVVTAPLLSLYGKYRPILERFDHIVHLPPADTAKEAELAFLASVLEARDPQGVLPSEMRRAVAKASGGVLRDMLALAKDAAQQAYMAGADTIGADHIQAAVSQLARTKWLGLNGNEIQMLRRVAQIPHGFFAPRTDAELALLMTRRILEYPQLGQEPRFEVHPVLMPLLAGAVGEPE